MSDKKYIEINQKHLGEKDYLEFRLTNNNDVCRYREIGGEVYLLDMYKKNKDIIDYKIGTDTRYILRETGNVIISTKNSMNLRIKSKLYLAIKKVISKEQSIQYTIITKREYIDIDGITIIIKKSKETKNLELSEETIIDDLLGILQYCKDLKESIKQEEDLESLTIKVKIENETLQSLYKSIKKAYKKANS